MFFFMTSNKKQQCYPLCFFSWRPKKNDSVTPYVFFQDNQWKITVLPIIFYLTKTTVKKCFFSWWPKKNNSVTPYVFFHATNKKQQCYPLCLFSRRPIKKQQCYPLCFFSWRPKKNDSVTPYVLFYTFRLCYPLWIFHDEQ